MLSVRETFAITVNEDFEIRVSDVIAISVNLDISAIFKLLKNNNRKTYKRNGCKTLLTRGQISIFFL